MWMMWLSTQKWLKCFLICSSFISWVDQYLRKLNMVHLRPCVWHNMLLRRWSNPIDEMCHLITTLFKLWGSGKPSEIKRHTSIILSLGTGKWDTYYEVAWQPQRHGSFALNQVVLVEMSKHTAHKGRSVDCEVFTLYKLVDNVGS